MPTKKRKNTSKYIRQILQCRDCMRTIVLTIRTPAYGISKYLAKIIQPTLNKNNNKIQNSTLFVHEIKDWKIKPTKTQVSIIRCCMPVSISSAR